MTIQEYSFVKDDTTSLFKPAANEPLKDKVFIEKINTFFKAAANTAAKQKNTSLEQVKKFTARLKPAADNTFEIKLVIERPGKKPLALTFSLGETPFTLSAPDLVQPVQNTAPIQSPPGIPNTGNTCFMAATFQAIMNDEVLREFIKDKCYQTWTTSNNSQTSNALKIWTVIQDYQDGQPVDLASLRSLLLSANGQPLQGYENGSTGDAEEFLYRILDCLDAKNYYDPQNNLKIGLVKAVNYTCVPVNANSSAPGIRTVKDNTPSFVLQVDLTSTTGLTGQQIIDRMLSPQSHEGEPFDIDGVRYRPTHQCTVIQTPPERFAISLKRFGAIGTKNSAPVDMPETLKMAGQNYRLKSIVVHIPGHYYSFVNKQGQWFKANDSIVTPVDDVTEGRQNGYLYFYEKI